MAWEHKGKGTSSICDDSANLSTRGRAHVQYYSCTSDRPRPSELPNLYYHAFKADKKKWDHLSSPIVREYSRSLQVAEANSSKARSR